MYEKELMMAILTAATALAGLSGVVIGQIAQSSLSDKAKFGLKVALICTFLLAILAVAAAIDWLSSPERADKLVAIISFGVQLCVFSGAAAAFWLKV